ncbi:MAG: NAD-dependent dehydratase [Planctomycetota bacterium]|nr:MAG: NAD-dependent dehydratase [Planctomycetota bacterium]
MKKTKVLVLGASGMLGSMVTDFLSRDEDLSVMATVRTPELRDMVSGRVGDVDWELFEIKDEIQTTEQLRRFKNPDWIVNAIGIIKPYARDGKPREVERAIVGNACFPYWLAEAFEKSCILQIATDCVYSGAKGNYVESDKHDALDVYGKTKSLGEVVLANINHLRCSIIGPEPKSYVSLLEWFRRQPKNAKISGFTNHLWNGVTTLHFAKICHGIIKNNVELPHLQHLIPDRDITKHDLLYCFGRCFRRSDIEITATSAENEIDRTLATENEDLNAELWQNAGYRGRPPTVPEMVEELAAFDYRFGSLEQ